MTTGYYYHIYLQGKNEDLYEFYRDCQKHNNKYEDSFTVGFSYECHNDRVTSRIDGAVFEFDIIVPQPENLSEKEILNWRFNNWGTIRSLGRTTIRIGDEGLKNQLRLSLFFRSAPWNVDLFFKHFTKIYSKFTIVVFEIGYFEDCPKKIVYRYKTSKNKRFRPAYTSKYSRALDSIDRKYGIIKPGFNVRVIEEDNSKEWADVASYLMVESIDRYFDVVLSNKTLNYSGIKSIDKVKSIEYMVSITECLSVGGNLVFKINNRSKSDELMKMLKTAFHYVELFKPHMLGKKNSVEYLICLGYNYIDMDLFYEKF